MRKEYDFAAARKNPYAAQLKKPVTIRLDQDALTYFKALADETGIPYQSLINLSTCAIALRRRRRSISPGHKAIGLLASAV